MVEDEGLAEIKVLKTVRRKIDGARQSQMSEIDRLMAIDSLRCRFTVPVKPSLRPPDNIMNKWPS